MESRPGRPEVHVLSWDTEGGRRAETNLLRSGQPLGLRVKMGGQWKPGTDFPARPGTGSFGVDGAPVVPDADGFAALEFYGGGRLAHDDVLAARARHRSRRGG